MCLEKRNDEVCVSSGERGGRCRHRVMISFDRWMPLNVSKSQCHITDSSAVRSSTSMTYCTPAAVAQCRQSVDLSISKLWRSAGKLSIRVWEFLNCSWSFSRVITLNAARPIWAQPVVCSVDDQCELPSPQHGAILNAKLLWVFYCGVWVWGCHVMGLNFSVYLPWLKTPFETHNWTCCLLLIKGFFLVHLVQMMSDSTWSRKMDQQTFHLRSDVIERKGEKGCLLPYTSRDSVDLSKLSEEKIHFWTSVSPNKRFKRSKVDLRWMVLINRWQNWLWSLQCFNCMLQLQGFLVQNNSCSISDFKSAKQVQKSLNRSISEHAKQDQNHPIKLWRSSLENVQDFIIYPTRPRKNSFVYIIPTYPPRPHSALADVELYKITIMLFDSFKNVNNHFKFTKRGKTT